MIHGYIKNNKEKVEISLWLCYNYMLSCFNVFTKSVRFPNLCTYVIYWNCLSVVTRRTVFDIKLNEKNVLLKVLLFGQIYKRQLTIT